MLKGEPVVINGDGETSRDFCYIANLVKANLMAATTANPEAVNQLYNGAVDDRTPLNQLYSTSSTICALCPLTLHTPRYEPFRPVTCAIAWRTSARRKDCSAINRDIEFNQGWNVRWDGIGAMQPNRRMVTPKNCSIHDNT